MKILFFLLIFFMIISCSLNKKVYWCGDHPCINKKEREAYFKKTMIVEVKGSRSKSYMNDSEIEKIIQESQSSEKKRIKEKKDLVKQAKLEEKNLAKKIKLEGKMLIKEEKKLAKQIKLEKKMRIKEEKKLAKQKKSEKKAKIKDKKKSSKKEITVNKKKQLKKNVELDATAENTEIKLGKFNELVEKIIRKNALKPYPDINDMAN